MNKIPNIKLNLINGEIFDSKNIENKGVSTENKLEEPKNIKNITVIGGGIIGSSWAALFSAYGKNVKIKSYLANSNKSSYNRLHMSS